MQRGTKIIGRYILAFVESTGKVSAVFRDKTEEMFADHGLAVEEIEEDSWHDALSYAEAMQDVRSEVGPRTLRQAGAEQASNVPYPGHVETVEDALEFLVQADIDAHRPPSGEYPGDYHFEKTGPSSGRMSVNAEAPYPVENFHGVFEGCVDTFAGVGAGVVTETEPNSGEKAAFEVTW